MGKYSWYDRGIPVEIANTNNYGDFGDWRVPTFKELQSLVTDKIHPSKHSNYEGFRIKKPLIYSMTMGRGRFWSSETNPEKTGCAYAVYFNRLRSNSKSEKGEKPKTELAYVRCVRLWMYEGIEREWNKIKNEQNMDVIARFIERYSQTSSYIINDATERLSYLKEKKRKYFDGLTPFDRKFVELLEGNMNNSRSSILLNAIEGGEFDGLESVALQNLESIMKEEGCWKENTNAKKTEKDRNYQKTLRAKSLQLNRNI